MSDVYILTKGKSITAEKNENVQLTHTQVFCGRLCVVRITVTKNKLYWCHGYLLVQNADCRPDTKCTLRIYILVCNNMSSYNLPSVNHAIALPRSAFTIICTIVEYSWPFLDQNPSNIVSSLPIVFSLCARVGWCDVCMIMYRFYQLNKSRCTRNTRYIRETIDSFARGPD